jgi:nucleoside transporter
MKPFNRILLSTMMFLQFFIWGAWYVTAPNYLGTIGFEAGDFGWTYSVGPISAMISPFFLGMVADRFFPAQRVLGILHLLGAALMYLATTMMGHASPNWINLVFFLYMLTYFPTLALVNTIAMRNMSNPQQEFPAIRVLGTIGWISANLALSYLGWSTKISMFYLVTGSAVLLGLMSFSLPHTPPTASGPVSARQVLGLDALMLLKDRAYLVFLIASTLICIPLAFYYQIASRLVEMMDFSSSGLMQTIQKATQAGDVIAATMSLGQLSEIFFMLVMPFFFRRLGVKWMLAAGMGAWVLRYALFAVGASEQVRWIILLGVLLHGVCYDFFFVTGQIYTDQKAPRHLRAQAQGLLVLFTLGLGMAIGAQLAARVESRHTPQASITLAKDRQDLVIELEQVERTSSNSPQIDEMESEIHSLRLEELRAIEWKQLWAKPGVLAAGILILFLLLFREKTGATPLNPANETPSGRSPAIGTGPPQ